LCALLVAVVLMPGGNTALGSLMLDDYDLPASPIQNATLLGPQASGATATSGVVVSDAVGGHRYIDLTIGTTGLSSGQTAAAVVSVGGSSHRYTFSLPDNTRGAGTVVYSGTNVATDCSLNLNLSSYNKFQTDITGVDHPITLVYTVFNATCSASSTYSLVLPFNDTGVKNLLFSGFSTPSIFSSGNIGRITISWNANTVASESLDMSWDYLLADCDTVAPVINSFTASPNPVAYGSNSSTLAWNITPGAGNPSSAKIESSCGVSGTPFYTSNMNTTFPATIPTFSCTFTLTAIGACGNATSQVIVTQAPPPGKVPSLNEWGMIILSLILAGSAIWMIKRKRTG